MLRFYAGQARNEMRLREYKTSKIAFDLESLLHVKLIVGMHDISALALFI